MSTSKTFLNVIFQTFQQKTGGGDVLLSIEFDMASGSAYGIVIKTV